MEAGDRSDIATLLSHYQERIRDFERERLEWLQRYEQVKLNLDSKIYKQRDLRKARDEILDIQRAVSEVRIQLFEEKQFKYKLEVENAELEHKIRVDENKMGDLIDVYEAVEQNIVCKKGKKPGK
jgi:predicted  nucleic acid-binding Zn-ribbon protein